MKDAVPHSLTTDANGASPVPKAGAALGERELWASVLHDAALLVAHGAIDTWKDTDREVRRARDWFRSSLMSPGSFRWICANLGIDYRDKRWRALAGKRIRKRMEEFRDSAAEGDGREIVELASLGSRR